VNQASVQGTILSFVDVLMFQKDAFRVCIYICQDIFKIS